MLPGEALGWVIGAMGRGSRVSSAHRIPLGGWHVNHAVEVVDARGRAHRLVLRRWARPGWERDDPDYTVERELRVLDLLRASEVPAPVVVAADPTGAQCGVPALLITRLPGDPRARPTRPGTTSAASSPTPSPRSTTSPASPRSSPTASTTTALAPPLPAGCRPRASGRRRPPRCEIRRRRPR